MIVIDVICSILFIVYIFVEYRNGNLYLRERKSLYIAFFLFFVLALLIFFGPYVGKIALQKINIGIKFLFIGLGIYWFINNRQLVHKALRNRNKK